MQILLISGFLGAGKTSFIKAMAKATGREFVIVENEFSEENIDSKILKKDDPLAQMEIVELSEGCICCSLNLDFSFSVMTIANTLNPDYLVVEPSGVAQPSNIVKDLEKITYEKISILAPITIIDSKNYQVQKRDYAEYFQDQLNTGGTVVLSKSEDLSEDDFQRIKGDLAILQDVHFPCTHYSKWSRQEWLKLFQHEFTGKDIKKIGERFKQKPVSSDPIQELENIALKNVTFINPDQCYQFLEEVLDDQYGQIVRAKGFVNISDEIIHIELVEKQFSMTGLSQEEIALIRSESDTSEDSQKTKEKEYDLAKLIFIGKNLKRQSLRLRLFSNTRRKKIARSLKQKGSSS